MKGLITHLSIVLICAIHFLGTGCAPTDGSNKNWLDLEGLAAMYDFEPIDISALDTTMVQPTETEQSDELAEKNETDSLETKMQELADNKADEEEHSTIGKRNQFVGDFVYAKLIEDSVDILWLSFRGDDKQMSFSYFDEDVDKYKFVSKYKNAHPLIKGKKCEITYIKERRPDSTIATKVVSIDILDEAQKIIAKGSTRGKLIDIIEKNYVYLKVRNLKDEMEEFVLGSSDDPTISDIYNNPQKFKGKQVEINWQIVERLNEGKEKEKVNEVTDIRIIEAPPPALTSPTNTLISYVMKLNGGNYQEALNMVLEEQRAPYDKFVNWADSRITKNKTVQRIVPMDLENVNLSKDLTSKNIQESVAVILKLYYHDGSDKKIDIALAKINGQWYIAE